MKKNLLKSLAFTCIALFLANAVFAQNVGVDQPAPVSKMDINGELTVGTTYSGTNAAPTNGAIIEGSVGIGTPNPSVKLEVNGLFKSAGTTEISDARFKKDVTEIENATEKVGELRGVNYTWKQDEFPNMNFSGEKQMGLIAQEVETVVPEVVMAGNDDYKSVDYSSLVALLIQALNEQQAEIELLKTQVAGMEEIKAELNKIKMELAGENAMK